MIRLDATNRKLQAVLAGAITTNQLPCTVSYSDKTSTDYVGATQLTNTNSTTQVDICAAPAASTVRDIDYVSIKNVDTAAATVSVIYDDNTTDYTIAKFALAVGDQLTYTHGTGWQVIASDGTLKTGAGLADGDKGDITVSSGTWTIDAAAVTLAKMANLAQDQFIGRTTASTGVPETATITAAARTVLDDTTVGAMATTLGLGTGDSPQFAGINLGHASDTTLTRASAGVVAVEGVNVVLAGAVTTDGITMSTARLLGRTTASTGAVEEITVGSGLSLSAGSLTATGSGITLGTPVASTSGTSIDFTSIPAGTKRVTINFGEVSTSGTSPVVVQLGDSGGVETTGYVGASGLMSTGGANAYIGVTSSIPITYSVTTAANTIVGTVTLTLLNSSTNKWEITSNVFLTSQGYVMVSAGNKSLSAELDRVRITTVGGSDTFDAGEINITYE